MKLPGAPDKICDLVAEAIVDEYLARDPEARVRVNVSGGFGALFVSGAVRTTADFDVSMLTRRVLGELGGIDTIEPFISLEQLPPDRAAQDVLVPAAPVTVTGFASAETTHGIPQTVFLARQIAKDLQHFRETRDDGFWLGPDAEVTVIADQTTPSSVALRIEHGLKNVHEARTQLTQLISTNHPNLHVRVNDAGPVEARGLSQATGASGLEVQPYGSLVPSTSPLIGLDIRHPAKAGAWLARDAARSLLSRGAKAILVTAIYFPGEFVPARLRLVDERGKNLSQEIPLQMFNLDRVLKDWLRPNLNRDAARWGYAGEPGLPWEM